jgi:hypothetical protein
MKNGVTAIVLACAATGAAAQPWDGDSGVPDLEWRGGAQLKRDWTSRGTPQESTKTQVEINTFIDSPVSFIRLTLSFPDADTDFGGDPFDPELGDSKVRAGFRALKHGKLSFPSYVELSFPTANPESAGSGKYEITAGIKMLAPFAASFMSDAHRTRFEADLSQTNSFAGDPARNDVNVTKAELILSDLWRERYTAKVSYKPSWDHVKHEDGAVVEIQVGFYFGEKEGRTHHPWRTWLMGGGRVSGPSGVSGTYNTRLELGLARTF